LIEKIKYGFEENQGFCKGLALLNPYEVTIFKAKVMSNQSLKSTIFINP
jgi:hypothetical protein